MDKYEYRVKTEQMLEYMEQKSYDKAMEIADTVDWHRVKNAAMLCSVSEIYELNDVYDKSRDVLFVAYDRAPGSRKIVYRLGILALKVGDTNEAMDCYEEFLAIAPKDPNQYILHYKILKAQQAPIAQQIEALADFKKAEYIEKWAYELAKLYHEAGMTTECLEECDDLILWFSEGRYVYQAMELKMQYKPLTPSQQEKYKNRPEENTNSKKSQFVRRARPQGEALAAKIAKAAAAGKTVAEEISQETQDLNVERDSIDRLSEEPLMDEQIAAEQLSEERFEEETVYETPMQAKPILRASIPEEPIPEEPIPEEPIPEEPMQEELIKEEPEVEALMQEELEPEELIQEDYELEALIQEEPDPEGLTQEEPRVEELMQEESEWEDPVTEVQMESEELEGDLPDEQPNALADNSTHKINVNEVVAAMASRTGDVAASKNERKENAFDDKQITGQMKIGEIIAGWHEKQQISTPNIAVEPEIKAEPKRSKKSASPILTDEIRTLMQELEGRDNVKAEDTVRKAPEELEPAAESSVMFNLNSEGEIPEASGTAAVECREYSEEYAETEDPEQEYSTQEYTDSKQEYSTQDYTEAEHLEEENEYFDEDDEDAEEYLDEETDYEDEYNDYEEAIEQESKLAGESGAQVNGDYYEESPAESLEAEKGPSRKEIAKAVATGKTAKLPIDEIAALTGSIPMDTGFIVQGRYDLDAQSEVGLRAGLTEEQKKLFSYFVPVRGMSEQLVDVLEQDKQCKNRQGTSRTGNLLIIGRKGSGKTVLAVDVVKAIQKQRDIKQGKVAIVTGESLNRKKVSEIINKLYGGALIIEKASTMNEKTIIRLNKAMERDTGELLIVLEEQRKPIDSLLASNKEFRRKFTSRLEVPIFINDELVTFGQTYAKENGYKIDEMGILALYSRIDLLQREDHAVTVSEVKDLMDEAVQHSQKGNVKKLMKRVLGKNTDDSHRIILTENDFNI